MITTLFPILMGCAAPTARTAATGWQARAAAWVPPIRIILRRAEMAGTGPTVGGAEMAAIVGMGVAGRVAGRRRLGSTGRQRRPRRRGRLGRDGHSQWEQRKRRARRTQWIRWLAGKRRQHYRDLRSASGAVPEHYSPIE